MFARRRSLVKTVAVLAALAVIASLSVAIAPGSAHAVAPPGETVGSGVETATITRDVYGVPTITAKAMPGVWFGAGYAQAEDRLAQLELVRRTVEGTLAQLAGSGYLAQDEDVRTFFYTPAESRPRKPRCRRRRVPPSGNSPPGSMPSRPKRSPPRRARRPSLPYEFFVLGELLGTKGAYRPAPWRPIDTVAVGDYLAVEFGGGGGSELQNLGFVRYLTAELTKKGDKKAAADAQAIFNDTRWINDPSAPTTVPSTPKPVSLESAGLSGWTASDLEGTNDSLRMLESVSTGAVLAAASALSSSTTARRSSGPGYRSKCCRTAGRTQSSCRLGDPSTIMHCSGALPRRVLGLRRGR